MGDVEGGKPTSKRVCIIGAGCAGIATLRALTRKADFCDVKVFDINPDVGGLWYFAENEGIKGKPGYLYKDLRTNGPRQSFEFSDLPQPDDVPTYLTAMDVKRYLKRYVDLFSLRKYIQFESQVDVVKKASQDQWSVTVTCNKIQHTHMFDFVILCNGIRRENYVPSFPGIEMFKGSKVHSGDFRCADDYAGRRVLIVGTRASMFDICLLVSKVASTVFISGRASHPLKLPNNCSDRPSVASFTEHAAIFEDGTETVVDAIIFCTGFGDITQIPFLDPGCGISKKNHYVYPLFNNIVNVNNPTMMFCGYFDYTWIFTLNEFMADYIETIVAGKTKLPSKQVMLDDIENEFKIFLEGENPPHTYSSIMNFRQRRLHNKLSAEAGINPPDEFNYKLYDHVMKKCFIEKQFHTLRSETYHKTPSGDLIVNTP